MAKLLELIAATVTIATGNLHNVLRDIFRNESGLKKWLICCSPGADIDATGSNIPTCTPGANLAVCVCDSITDPGLTFESVTIEKAGSGYKVSVAGVANLDTPAKCASIAYGDPNRTTFSSLQDFALRALDGPIQSELGAGFGVVVIDQVGETVDLLGDPTLSNCSQVVLVEQDDAIGSQFGE